MRKRTNRSTRHQAIRRLLEEESIPDQNSLVIRLGERFNIHTNQAVVSRDLRTLGVTKRKVKGQWRHELPQVDPTSVILQQAIVKVLHNEVMILIHTVPGLAPFVGDCVDLHHDLDVAGSISGENCVMVIPKSITEVEDVYIKLCSRLKYKKNFVYDEDLIQ